MKNFFLVYYRKPTDDGWFKADKNLTRSDVLNKEKFVYLCAVEAKDLEDVFCKMQGEVWSPNGEAKSLIRATGVRHTSMSVGDVIFDGYKFYQVDTVGFLEVKTDS